MIVIDASAFVKIFVEEDGSEKATNMLKEAINRREIVAAPEILLPETLNALWKMHTIRKELTKSETEAAANEAIQFSKRIVKISTLNIASSAMSVAIGTKLSIYDSLYAAASLANNAVLFTYDEKLRDKAQEIGIKLLA